MVVSLRISFILKQIGDQFRKTNAAYCGTQTIIQSAIADFSAANTDLFTANANASSAFVFILSHFPLFVYPISLFSVKNPTCYAAQVCYSIVSCKTISFCHSDLPFARLMKDRFFVILILPLALLSEESQKTQDTGYPAERSQGVFSANEIHSFR